MALSQRVLMSNGRAGHRGEGRAGRALLAGLLCSWPAVDAFAQSEDAMVLPTIVVTARKVPENLQSVPSAVTTLRGEEVERFDISSLEKAAAITPGLIITRGNSGSGASISLRGIGPNFSSIGIEQSVAVMIDGVYYGQGRVIDAAFFDLSQIDVLKGPQALYWGKNSTAGVLSITSANPTRERELMGRVGYEFRNRNPMAGFVVSGPVTDKLGLRLAVNGQNMQGGYVQNDAQASTYTTFDTATPAVTAHSVPPPSNRDLPAERSAFARLSGTYKADNTLDFTLKATVDHRKLGATTWNNRLWNCPNDTRGQPCGESFSVMQNPVPADIAATRTYMNKYGGQPYSLYDAQSLTVKVDKTYPTVMLSSITNYQHFEYSSLSDYDFSGAPVIWADEHDKYHAFSEELRASTSFNQPVNFMAGLYFQRTKLDFEQGNVLLFAENSLASASDRYLGFSKDSATDGQTVAAYGQVTWKFLPDWEYILGGRYTRERKSSFFAQPYVSSSPLFAAYPPNARLDADQRFNDFSPATTLTWKPASNLTLYTAYRTGYKSGGFSNSAIISLDGNGLADLAFEPETVKGVEAGLKATLLDNRLRLNIDAYRYEYSDLQIDFFDAQNLNLITTNAGSAVVKGLEVAAEYLPPAVRGLKLLGSAQYNIARYKSYIAPCFVGQTAAEGCVPTAAGNRQDLAGKPTANAPKWTASIGADYAGPLWQQLIFGLSGRLRYSSEYSLSPFGQPVAVQSSYVNFDAALRLGAADDTWQVALVGKNLTNNFVATSSFEDPLGSPPGSRANQWVLFAPPRTVALEVTYRF